jgi:hypothetical protein
MYCSRCATDIDVVEASGAYSCTQCGQVRSIHTFKIPRVPTFVARWANGVRGAKLGREMRRGGGH